MRPILCGESLLLTTTDEDKTVKRTILFCLLGGVLTAATGCGLGQAIFCYRPCAMRGDCDSCGCNSCSCSNSCDEGCCPTCRSARLSRSNAACSDCDGDVDCGRPCRGTCARGCVARNDSCDCNSGCDSGCGCDSCGGCDPCCDRPWHRGPVSCLFGWLMQGCWCGPCCGERYWGDFYTVPPDCWGPCDCHGNYTGRGCRDCAAGGRNAVCPTCGRRYGVAPPQGEVYDSGEDGEIVEGGNADSSGNATTAPPAKWPTNEPHRAVRPQN